MFSPNFQKLYNITEDEMNQALEVLVARAVKLPKLKGEDSTRSIPEATTRAKDIEVVV